MEAVKAPPTIFTPFIKRPVLHVARLLLSVAVSCYKCMRLTTSAYGIFIGMSVCEPTLVPTTDEFACEYWMHLTMGTFSLYTNVDL